jgi:hypothetical protein
MLAVRLESRWCGCAGCRNWRKGDRQRRRPAAGRTRSLPTQPPTYPPPLRAALDSSHGAFYPNEPYSPRHFPLGPGRNRHARLRWAASSGASPAPATTRRCGMGSSTSRRCRAPRRPLPKSPAASVSLCLRLSLSDCLSFFLIAVPPRKYPWMSSSTMLLETAAGFATGDAAGVIDVARSWNCATAFARIRPSDSHDPGVHTRRTHRGAQCRRECVMSSWRLHDDWLRDGCATAAWRLRGDYISVCATDDFTVTNEFRATP